MVLRDKCWVLKEKWWFQTTIGVIYTMERINATYCRATLEDGSVLLMAFSAAGAP